MIKIIKTKTGLAPFFFCDVCDKPILDARQALAAMPKAKMDEQGRREVLHVHKDDCFPALEAKTEQLVDTVELVRHLDLLVQNSGIDLEDMKETRESWAKFGL
jgi:hypothetical protein